jgi:hypothetical protein
MLYCLSKGMNMWRQLTTFALVGIFVYAQIAHAAMSSTNYEIRWDAISTGGSDTSNSSSYILRDTAGGSAGSSGSSTSYQLTDGYRAGVFDQILTFDHYIQNRDSQVVASALSGTTVTVTSSSGYSVNDYVVLIQNTGTDQVTAFGRISSIGGSTITLDRLTTAGTTPTIDGVNDFLYPMNASSIAFSTLSNSGLTSIIVSFETTIDNDSGYSIQILEDGQLRVNEQTIDDVTDGSVTIGSEEYGGRSSDSTVANSTFDTQDTAISSIAQEIVTNSTFVFDERSYLTLKTAISSSTQPGNYSQTLTFIVSGNF